MMHPTTETILPRTYLYVPPEEKSEVQALGASWDASLKSWYIDADEMSERFSRWLPAIDDDEEFNIASDRASVAVARVHCQHCHVPIEVICIQCESGTANGAQLAAFTVSNIGAMDDALLRQLAPWPTFSRIVDPASGDMYFANHCSSCHTVQDDMLLHSEPGEPFFDVSNAIPGSIDLVPLRGSIQLSGDEHFEIG
jgi:hypothetical protein